MRTKLYLTFGLLFCLIAGEAYAQCAGTPGSVARIVCLADSLKATLTASQVSTLQLAYSYSNAQSWSNLPIQGNPRLGLRLDAMSAASAAIAKLIVREVTYNRVNEGYDEVKQVQIADSILRFGGGGNGYGPGLYFLCFNGTPTATGLFSVKFGGHHLQVENTYNNGVMVGGTPHFEAIEPVTFTDAGGNTYAPISQEKNALAAMFASLSTTELASARLTQTFSDILMGARNMGSSRDWTFPSVKVGMRVGSLSAAQKALVLAAIETYVRDVDSVHSGRIMSQYARQIDSTYIAYSGNATLTNRNDYARIDGPGVWIEFSCQNGIVFTAVHYHSIWRDHLRDYGGQGGPGIQTTEVGIDTVTALPAQDNLFDDAGFFPNPAQAASSLYITLRRRGRVTVRVYDGAGRLCLMVFEGELDEGRSSMLVSTAALPPGHYYCQISGDNRRQSLSFVKN